MGVVQILSVLFRMTCRSLIFLALVAAGQAAIAPAAEYEDAQAGIRFTEEDKLRLVKELEDEELSKEIENLVSNLDDEQLEQLEEILAKDLDEASEFDMLMAELKEMGMDEEDIKDLLELSGMMTKFLNKVPEVEQAVLVDSPYTLEDNVKLYLLGLPNNLGPLGFLALHSVLQDGDDDIVDVKIGEFEPDTTVESVGDVITRKRRAKEEAAAAAPKPEVKYSSLPRLKRRRLKTLWPRSWRGGDVRAALCKSLRGS